MADVKINAETGSRRDAELIEYQKEVVNDPSSPLRLSDSPSLRLFFTSAMTF